MSSRKQVDATRKIDRSDTSEQHQLHPKFAFSRYTSDLLRRDEDLYKRYPTARPARRPQMAANGMEEPGSPKETPPRKTTASRPSRATVIAGKMSRAYLVPSDRLTLTVSVSAAANDEAHNLETFLPGEEVHLLLTC